MADGVAVERAVALDPRVEVVVAVDLGAAVDSGAAAGLAADVPRRRPPRLLAPPPQDRVQRRHCTRARNPARVITCKLKLTPPIL